MAGETFSGTLQENAKLCTNVTQKGRKGNYQKLWVITNGMLYRYFLFLLSSLDPLTPRSILDALQKREILQQVYPEVKAKQNNTSLLLVCVRFLFYPFSSYILLFPSAKLLLDVIMLTFQLKIWRTWNVFTKTWQKRGVPSTCCIFPQIRCDSFAPSSLAVTAHFRMIQKRP